jgi:hypothetical protein
LTQAMRDATRLNDDRPVQVTVETVFTSGKNPLAELSPSGSIESEFIGRTDASFLRLTDAEGPWILASLPTRHPDVFHIVSGVPRTHGRWAKVERWMARARDVSRCFLNHRDFVAIGDRLNEFGAVEVIKVAARMVKDDSSVNRGFPVRESSRRPTHREEIDEMEGLGAYVRTITLQVSEVLQLHLRRSAGATYYSGDFRLFANEVLPRLEDAAAARRDLLSGRARSRAAEPVEALTVQLGVATFESADDTGDILSLLSSMPDLSVAVFHRNPYLHFTVTDEHDGSNFDVLITRSDAVDIYPGFRATTAALARVSQRIGERFGATQIASAAAAEPISIYELV